MFCPNCGVKNEDNVAFCKNCGTKLGNIPPVNSQNAEPVQPQAEQPVQQPVETEQPQEASVPTAQPSALAQQAASDKQATPAAVYAPAVSTARPRSNHPVLKAVKDLGASPLFLIAVIAFTAAVFFNLVSIFTRSSASIYSLNEAFGRFGIDELNGTLYQMKDYLKAIGVFSLIPSAIYLIGLWMIFAGAQQRGSDGMPTSGLTTIKVMAIIALVFVCIALALSEIVCVLAIIGISGYYSYANVLPSDYGYGGAENMVSTFATAILVGVAIGALIVYVILIVYEAKIISTINAVKGTILTGNPNYKVSGFVAVMNFIAAFFSLFGLFAGGFAALLSEACSITALICFGILIFKYKSAMIRLLSTGAGYDPAFVPNSNVNTAAALNQDGGNNTP